MAILQYLANPIVQWFIIILMVVGVVLYLTLKRNYWNKHKYIRLVKYNDNMTVSITYYKRDEFNQDNSILIDPKNVFDCNGYKSVIISSNSQESINPLTFKSSFDPKNFKSAMRSKLIKETFDTLKVEKFDRMMLLLVLSGLQLLTIVYLLYYIMGGMNG